MLAIVFEWSGQWWWVLPFTAHMHITLYTEWAIIITWRLSYYSHSPLR